MRTATHLNLKNTFLLILTLLMVPGMILAQVSPGATITTDLTLTADLDASSYAGTALIVGANNITIDGAGYTITVNGNNFAFDLSSRSGVTIQNVTVVGTASQQGRGVLLGNTNTAVIQNNTFSGLYDGLFAQGTNSTCTITGNDMSGSGTGFSSQTYVNNVQFTVTDNNMTNCTGWAMAYQGTPAEINGNDFSGSASGLILLNAVRSAGNEFVMTWQGEASGPNKNTFGDHTALLMQLHGSQFLDITGWDFASLYAAGTNLTQKQGLYLGNTHNSTFANNTFSGLGYGIYATGTNNNNTVSGNTMTGCGQGLGMDTYVNNGLWTITNNDMTNCTGWAMAYQGNPAEINGNDFSGSASGLILLNAVRSAGNEFVMTWQGEASGPNKNTFGDHSAVLMQLHGSQFLDITGWDFASLYAAGTNLTQKQGIYLGNTPKKAHSECWIGAGASGPIPIPGTGDQHLGL